MYSSFRVFLLGLLLTTTAAAAPPQVVEIPRDKPGEWNEIRSSPGRLLRLGAEPASKWLLVDEDAVDLAVFDGGKSAAFVSPVAGRFKLIVTSPDGTPARVVVAVADGPAPPPKPPEPADPLRQRLRKAFDDDGDPKKDEQRKDLAALYRAAAEMTTKKDDGEWRDATVASLVTRLKNASNSFVGVDALKPVRKIAGEELLKVADIDGPLDDARRKKIADLFIRLAGILDSFGD